MLFVGVAFCRRYTESKFVGVAVCRRYTASEFEGRCCLSAIYGVKVRRTLLFVGNIRAKVRDTHTVPVYRGMALAVQTGMVFLIPSNSRHSTFPFQSFGKSASVKRCFRLWFNKFGWLHYDTAKESQPHLPKIVAYGPDDIKNFFWPRILASYFRHISHHSMDTKALSYMAMAVPGTTLPLA